jgi:hypothetical protein
MTLLFTNHIFAAGHISWVLLFFVSQMITASAHSHTVFKGSTRLVSDDGHVRLEWLASGPGAVYEIQQAETPYFENPKSIYKGPDLGTFVSGLRNGKYYYRVRTEGGDWSDTLELDVKHHSLRLAYILSGLGAIVFLLTVWVVLRGTSKTVTRE